MLSRRQRLDAGMDQVKFDGVMRQRCAAEILIARRHLLSHRCDKSGEWLD